MSFIKFFKNKKDGKKNIGEENKKEIKKSETKNIEKKNIDAEKTKSKSVASERQKIGPARQRPEPQAMAGGSASPVYKSIKFPHITEKSTNLANFNKYVFRVLSGANKIEIAKSVAGFYGVTVESVNIINIHRKKRFLRRREGYKSGYKKAIVTLKQGDKIEIAPH